MRIMRIATLLTVALIATLCLHDNVVHARRELNDHQRILAQLLQQLMPGLVPPTLPITSLLQQRANVRWITRDAWFENIECAKNNRNYLMCGIYVTHAEMQREGWAEALLYTIDAADDALNWRGYEDIEYFVQYDPFLMPYSADVARAQCLFERGQPIMAQLHEQSQGFLSSMLSMQTSLRWLAQRWHCTRYHGFKLGHRMMYHLRDLWREISVARLPGTGKTEDASNIKKNQTADANLTPSPSTAPKRRRLRCTDGEEDCEPLL